MNIAAHVLTGVAVLPKSKQNLLKEAIFWSIFPDLIWGAIEIPYLIFHGWKLPTDWSDSPLWFYCLYGLGHSLVIWTTIFFAVLIIRKKVYWPLWFWLLHILIDILGHTHFTTPFLFPISTFHFKGLFSWTDYTISTLSYILPMAVILFRYKLVLKKV